MSPHEKQKLLADLHQGRTLFLDALRDVSEDLTARPPAPGSWSVLECVEHIAVSEDYLFSQILAARSVPEPMINSKREAMIVAVGLDRNRKIQAPDVGKPAGRFSTLAEAVGRFQSVRARTIEFTQNCSDDLRCRITSHPLLDTPVNCYEMLLMIAVHPYRHAKQIEEIKAALKQSNP